MSQKINNPCRLCQKKEADQTGSHLISCLIVSSQIGQRGNEKGFMITGDPYQDYSENLGAEGIKEDCILCAGCEKRLSFVESYFSQEFINKIDKENYAQNFPLVILEKDNSSKYFKCNNVNSIAFHLLIYSIVWRASISGKPIFAGFNLEKSMLDKLRFMLDLYLPEYRGHKIVPKLKSWLKDIESVPEYFFLYPYVILRSEKEGISLDVPDEEERENMEKRKTKNLIYFSFENDHPYHIILNDFIILIFSNERSVDFSTQDFFELSGRYDLEGQMNKDLSEPPRVGILSGKDWRRIHLKLFSLLKAQLLENIRRECVSDFISNARIPNKKQIDRCVLDKAKWLLNK